jgi:hypothetical protein
MGYHVPGLRIQLKLADGKKLTKAEHNIILAFKELEAALTISKADRWDRESVSLKDTSKRNEVKNQKINDNGDFKADYSEEDYASDVASYEHVEPKL